MAGCLTVQSLNQDNLRKVVATALLAAVFARKKKLWRGEQIKNVSSTLTWRCHVRLSLAHSFALTGATRPSLPEGERKRRYQATLSECDAISLTPGFSQVWYTHSRATSRFNGFARSETKPLKRLSR
jgi:hypothetical protein